MNLVLGVLANESFAAALGALLGASAAFMLVALSDMRRRYRERCVLRSLIADNIDLARRKRKAVTQNEALFKEEERITEAPLMLFSTHAIQDYKIRVLDVLAKNESACIDALIYWMEAIDTLLRDMSNAASRMKHHVKAEAQDKIQEAGKEYVEYIDEVKVNLGILREMGNWYLAKQYGKIFGFKHPLAY